MRRLVITGAALYAIIGVVTFGHSAAYADREDAACEARSERRVERGRDPAFCPNDAPVAGFTAAILWPLYWSWEAWS